MGDSEIVTANVRMKLNGVVKFGSLELLSGWGWSTAFPRTFVVHDSSDPRAEIRSAIRQISIASSREFLKLESAYQAIIIGLPASVELVSWRDKTIRPDHPVPIQDYLTSIPERWKQHLADRLAG